MLCLRKSFLSFSFPPLNSFFQNINLQIIHVFTVILGFVNNESNFMKNYFILNSSFPQCPLMVGVDSTLNRKLNFPRTTVHWQRIRGYDGKFGSDNILDKYVLLWPSAWRNNNYNITQTCPSSTNKKIVDKRNWLVLVPIDLLWVPSDQVPER